MLVIVAGMVCGDRGQFRGHDFCHNLWSIWR